jgi:radical SAM superfamily enzyme YgiQ (UPF0313 family)
VRALAIQPGIAYPEAAIAGRHQSVRQTEGYIEIGLLSLASYLETKGVQIQLVNLDNEPDITSALRTKLLHFQPDLVAISCMSGYAYTRLQDVASLAKEVVPTCYVVTGGQHTAPLGRLVLEESPFIDCVVTGEGEGTSWEVCNCLETDRSALASIPGTVQRFDGQIISPPGDAIRLNLNELPHLNYQLFPNFQNFVPRLEESRGCAWDCAFCSNASVFGRKVRYKSASQLIDELVAIRIQYGEPAEFGFYLISKTYGFDRQVTREFGQRVAGLPFRVQWRTQTRADVFDPALLPDLSAAGLTVLDVGLESASPKMLLAMDKTRNVQKYLDGAIQIIEAAQGTSTKIKINLLFHPGETPETIAETLAFLLPLRGKVSAVTVSPVMVDPGAPLWRSFGSYEKKFGASLIRSPMWDAYHIYPANPSKEITFDQVNTLSVLISKMFQGREDYIASRRLGGALRGMTPEELDARLELIPDHLKPYAL